MLLLATAAAGSALGMSDASREVESARQLTLEEVLSAAEVSFPLLRAALLETEVRGQLARSASANCASEVFSPRTLSSCPLR